jgi:hypothetical protein
VTRVLVLVEGQTEERFVKDVLDPYFSPLGIYLSPTLLMTKRVKDGPNFKGGVTNFAKFSNDVTRLLADPEAVVTTMLDYYALPNDFPGMTIRPVNVAPVDRVTTVENALDDHFNNPRFRSFLALHEFEAFVFSSPDELPRAIPDGNPNSHGGFRQICHGNLPEDINEGPLTAPSKRLAGLYPSYRKTLHGPLVTERIGLVTIRARCPHFNDWLTFLESLVEV